MSDRHTGSKVRPKEISVCYNGTHYCQMFLVSLSLKSQHPYNNNTHIKQLKPFTYILGFLQLVLEALFCLCKTGINSAWGCLTGTY